MAQDKAWVTAAAPRDVFPDVDNALRQGRKKRKV